MITTDAQPSVLAVLAATVQAWSANDAEAFAALYSDATRGARRRHVPAGSHRDPRLTWRPGSPGR